MNKYLITAVMYNSKTEIVWSKYYAKFDRYLTIIDIRIEVRVVMATAARIFV
jgi:hypothetical protein